MAGNPSEARIRADPISHALGIKKVPDLCKSANLRRSKAVWLDAWVISDPQAPGEGRDGQRRQCDSRLGGWEVVRVDERVDPRKGLPLDHAAQERLGRGSDLRRVAPDPPEEVPVRAEPRFVLQGLERVLASVVGDALLDECRSYVVGRLDVQTRHVEQQRLEARKLRCQVRSWPQHHMSGTASPPKEVVRSL